MRHGWMTAALVALLTGIGPTSVCAQCPSVDLASTDLAADDHFGTEVGVDRARDVAIVGAPNDDDAGSFSGSAYIFRHDGSKWIQEQKLVASDGSSSDGFGSSVSISADVAVVGAPFDDDNGPDSGSAYVFRFDGSTWVQEQKLVPLDGFTDDRFGLAVSIRGEVILVGVRYDNDAGSDSGSVYAYRWSGSTWVQEQKIFAGDGAEFDRFGTSVALGDDVAVIGAAGDSDFGSNTGSAYVFRYSGTTWIEEQKLVASDAALQAGFGRSVDVRGNLVVVGARGAGVSLANSGAAYVFAWDGTAWNEQQILTASDAAEQDLFGHSVAIDREGIADGILVGAIGVDDGGDRTGAAYYFRWNGSTWSEEQKLVAPDPVERDELGWSTALFGDEAFMTRPQLFFPGFGSLLVVSVDPFECAPDFVRGDCNADGSVSIGDALRLLTWLLQSAAPPTCESACDVTSDDSFDIADPVYLLSYLFVAGPAPEEPFPSCGSDPTTSVPCESPVDCP